MRRFAFAMLAAAVSTPAAAASFVNALTVANGTDLSGYSVFEEAFTQGHMRGAALAQKLKA